MAFNIVVSTYRHPTVFAICLILNPARSKSAICCLLASWLKMVDPIIKTTFETNFWIFHSEKEKNILKHTVKKIIIKNCSRYSKFCSPTLDKASYLYSLLNVAFSPFVIIYVKIIVYNNLLLQGEQYLISQ